MQFVKTKTAGSFTRAVCTMLLFLMMFSLFVPSAYADTYTSPENFVITGEFKDTFRLTTNKENIFSMDGCVPGDAWEGEIHVTNVTGVKMEICILSIESLIDDLDLYEQLELEIKKGRDVIYSGSYGKTDIPVSPYYDVKAGDTLVFDVYVYFPGLASGNEYQGKPMESLWTFDARHPGYPSGGGDPVKPEEPVDPEDPVKPDEPVVTPDEPEEPIIVPGEPVEPTPEKPSGIKTGIEFIDNNTMPIMILFMAILAIVIAAGIVRKARREE